MSVVGADGARGGWVAVQLRDGRLGELAMFDDIGALLAAYADAEALAVDMPLGHEMEDARGRRACDLGAQQELGPRRASVFPVPPLELLELPSHEAACARAAERGWAAPSRQLWALRARIVEVGRAAEHDARLREAHPELSFQELQRSQGGPEHLGHSKHTWNGLFERLDLLRKAGLRPARVLGGVGRASPDDVLDATALAWTAQRIARGEARSVPARPPRDPRTGRPVAVWV
jgi:predicted RNase H-like nuclease